MHTTTSQYCRYWCKLSALDGSQGTLLPLMKSCEELVHAHAPGLCAALGAAGVPVGVLVQPLLRFGAVGFLPPPQVLLLWDRMVAGDDTSILAVAAAALVLLHGASVLAQLKEEGGAHGGACSPSALDAARDIMASNAEWIAIIPLCQAVLHAQSAQGR